MALIDELRKQRTPAEALAWLARYCESLESRIQELERANVSGWDEWSDETPPLTDDTEWQEPEGVREEIAELREQLKGNESDEDSKAIRAQIELLEDKLVPPPDLADPTGEQTHQIMDDAGNVVVETPAVSEEKEDAREEFARKVLKLVEVYGEEQGTEYIKSYRKAGPLLLYYSDRDFVLGLPDEVRAAMVVDVAEQSPKEAHEMGRDILKDGDANPPDISIENLIRTMAG